jgi:hypothetical protein
MSRDAEHQFWYNLKTGQVAEGMVSPAVERVGPFETRAEAERALEILRANSAKWAEEEAAEE